MKTLRELESRLGGRVIAIRWPIIAVSMLLVAAAGSGVLFLEFSPDHRIYFAKDNPQLLALEAMERTYGESGNVFFAVAPESRDATSALALEATAWLTEQSWQTPYSTRVDSVTNFQHTTADGDDLLVRDLVDEGAWATPVNGRGFAPSPSPSPVSQRVSWPATEGSAGSMSPCSCRARTNCSRGPGSPSSRADSRTRFGNASPGSRCE